MEYIIIDPRMRNVEKNTLKYLGYELVPIQRSNNVYPEISSHVDIFTTKIGDTLVVEKSQFEDLTFMLKKSEYNIVRGKEQIEMNDFNIPMDISTFGIYTVYTSLNVYQAGTYTIDINY